MKQAEHAYYRIMEYSHVLVTSDKKGTGETFNKRLEKAKISTRDLLFQRFRSGCIRHSFLVSFKEIFSPYGQYLGYEIEASFHPFSNKRGKTSEMRWFDIEVPIELQGNLITDEQANKLMMSNDIPKDIIEWIKEDLSYTYMFMSKCPKKETDKITTFVHRLRKEDEIPVIRQPIEKEEE